MLLSKPALESIEYLVGKFGDFPGLTRRNCARHFVVCDTPLLMEGTDRSYIVFADT